MLAAAASLRQLHGRGVGLKSLRDNQHVVDAGRQRKTESAGVIGDGIAPQRCTFNVHLRMRNARAGWVDYCTA